MIWYSKVLKLWSKINKSVGALLDAAKEFAHPTFRFKTKTYLIKAIKSRRFDKHISFVRQTIAEPTVVKEYPDQVVLKQHFTDKKHYKYIGKLISPVLKSQLNPNAHPLNIKGFEDIVQKMTSKEISNYLTSNKALSRLVSPSNTFRTISKIKRMENTFSLFKNKRASDWHNDKINKPILFYDCDLNKDRVKSISPINTFRQEHQVPWIPQGIRKSSVKDQKCASPVLNQDIQINNNAFSNILLLIL